MINMIIKEDIWLNYSFHSAAPSTWLGGRQYRMEKRQRIAQKRKLLTFSRDLGFTWIVFLLQSSADSTSSLPINLPVCPLFEITIWNRYLNTIWRGKLWKVIWKSNRGIGLNIKPTEKGTEWNSKHSCTWIEKKKIITFLPTFNWKLTFNQTSHWSVRIPIALSWIEFTDTFISVTVVAHILKNSVITLNLKWLVG